MSLRRERLSTNDNPSAKCETMTLGTEEKKGALKVRLAHVRESSLLATRRGDIREVARLTTEAAKINSELSQLGSNPMQ